MCDIFVEEHKKMSDNEIIARINSGEYELFQLLIGRYMPMICKTAEIYCFADTEREDFIEEGILAVFSAVRSYDPEKSQFSTFVNLCIRRAMATQVRSAMGKGRIPDKLISPIDDIDISDLNSPENIFIEKESLKDLTDRIRLELSELEYGVLCEFLSGKSYSEIAEKLKITAKSVDNALKRIRTKLKDS